MRITELHESPFTFRERLAFAFLAGFFTGAAIALFAVLVFETTNQ